MRFNGGVKLLGVLDGLPSQDEIRKIPQFFRADADMVYRIGGEFLRRFLLSAPLEYKWAYISIDTRVHMLMPGWYPCIPGWHCDDFYRPSNDQPDLLNVYEKAWANHIMVVTGATSFTQFLRGPAELPSPDELPDGNRALYGKYDNVINGWLVEREIETLDVGNGQVVQFTPLDFHRGVQANQYGWRLFARITQSNHWQPLNELRTQTQVYLTEPSAGW